MRKPADWFVFLFRGSPLFIPFFLGYEALQMLPNVGINVFGSTVDTGWTALVNRRPNRRLNRHLPSSGRSRIRLRPQIIR